MKEEWRSVTNFFKIRGSTKARLKEKAQNTLQSSEIFVEKKIYWKSEVQSTDIGEEAKGRKGESL